MKSIFSVDSPLMNMLRQLADLIILNLLWLVGCLPIFTIGASTTALYQAIIKMRRDGSIPVWSNFWKFFRSNFKQATILFVIVAVASTLAAGGVWIILADSGIGSLLKLLMLIPILLIMLTVGFVFPLQAQFENTVLNTLKNAWVMSRIHFVVAIVVLMLNMFPVAFFLLFPEVFFQCVPIWVSLAGSLIAYINTALLQRIFKRYIPAEDNQE